MIFYIVKITHNYVVKCKCVQKSWLRHVKYVFRMFIVPLLALKVGAKPHGAMVNAWNLTGLCKLILIPYKQVQRKVFQVVRPTDGSEAMGHSEHAQKQHSLSSSLLHVEPLGIKNRTNGTMG